MKRNVKRNIAEYVDLVSAADVSPAACFYVSDAEQIIDIGKGDKYSLVFDSLMYGFMIGYKYAKRNGKARK